MIDVEGDFKFVCTDFKFPHQNFEFEEVFEVKVYGVYSEESLGRAARNFEGMAQPKNEFSAGLTPDYSKISDLFSEQKVHSAEGQAIPKFNLVGLLNAANKRHQNASKSNKMEKNASVDSEVKGKVVNIYIAYDYA